VPGIGILSPSPHSRFFSGIIDMAAAPELIEEAGQQAGGAIRYNIYRVIHKALRAFMTDTLQKVGRADIDDDCERTQALESVRALLATCLGHLRHENEFVHPALERARSGAAQQTADDHEDHVTAIEKLQAKLVQVQQSQGSQRAELWHELYLALSHFVAENFEHMIVEETHNHAILVSAYSDAEILGIQQAIVASLTPEESMTDMRWMLPFISARERAFLLSGMKTNVPQEVFGAVLALARDVLSQRDFYKLERTLG